jgi:DNA-binding transcriptional ArsR family regulator
MKDPLEPEHCATMLKALSAPERLRIIRFLRGGPKNATEISEALDIPPVNLTHHLMVLKHAGFLIDERHGRFIRYSLKEGMLERTAADEMTEHLNLGCCRLEIPKPNSQ